VGTSSGSLIPISGEDGETSFVKDSGGQVVKSKLDEKRLREVAQVAGGFYLHLENGPRTMQQLYTEGLSKMQAVEMDVRLSRRPIERYEWPLGGALAALALSILIGERRRSRERVYAHTLAKIATAATALWLAVCQFGFGAAPGLDAYRDGKFNDAYSQFQQTLKTHPQSRAEDKLQFDSGAAAYKSEEYIKALESFSQALLSPDNGLQSKSHYNLGNTLYQRGEAQKSDDKKLSDWTNALDHYQQTLKLEPQNKEAKDNYDYVKKKIDDLKNKKQQQQPRPSPSPSPQQKDKQQKQNQQNQQSQQDQQQNQQQQQQQQQQQEQQNQQQQKDQQQQSQDRQSQNGQSQGKNEPQQSKQQKGNQPSPSPSPGEKEQNQQQSGEGEQSSPTPGDHGNEMPSPSPSATNGEGSEENPTPSATPTESPQKKFAGEVKGAGKGESEKPTDKNARVAEGEAEKEGQMSQRQAEALLQSMKDEEARVQLDERKASRRVYNDW